MYIIDEYILYNIMIVNVTLDWTYTIGISCELNGLQARVSDRTETSRPLDSFV